MKENLVSVEPAEFTGAYCPVCGKEVVGPDAEPCEHTLFVFVGAIGEFTHQTPAVASEIQRWIEDEDFVDSLEEKGWGIIDHLQTIIPENAFTIQIMTSGMACGPASNIDYICFEWTT